MAGFKSADPMPAPDPFTPAPASAPVPAPEPVYNFPPNQVGEAGTDVKPPIFPKFGVDGRPYDITASTVYHFQGGKLFVVVPGGMPFKFSDYEVKPLPTPAPVDLVDTFPAESQD